MATPASNVNAGKTALPSAEEARFDRSLRLWGAEAQQRLRSAHVVLLGATSTGCEMLKNLVLPGLGNFTVVDSANVTLRDLGNNFFLEQSDEGRNRAEAVAPILAELNPMAAGNACTRSIADVVDHAEAALLNELKATLVIASSDVTLDQLKRLSVVLKGKDVPLVYAVCNGMHGVVRIQADPQFILHTMPGPDTKVHDLRALNPFPELEEFFLRRDPGDVDGQSHHEFAHTPWFCVIYHALKKWRSVDKNKGKAQPATGAEWREVKQIIEGYAREDPVTKLMKLPDSFKDAQEYCSVRLDVTRRNTQELNQVLRHPKCISPQKGDDPNWFLAHGLLKFRQQHNGVMPLSGTIPDFECTTDTYRTLQHLFRDQAIRDAKELGEYARAAAAAAGEDASALISDDDILNFSRQAWEVNYVTFPSIADEFTAGGLDGLSQVDESKISAAGTAGFNWFVVYRAALLFASRHGNVPPGRVESAEAATEPIDSAIDEVAEILKSEVWPSADIESMKPREVREWVRYGGSEIVTVASIVGAVASQESIKLIQRRRRPVTHTLVYDGIENCFTTISGPEVL